VKKLTIPEIRHCMLALAQKIGGADGDLLRYLAEQTRRAPRGSKGDGSNIPPGPTPEPRQASWNIDYSQHAPPQGNGAASDDELPF
jgi:hypothetical protein